MLTALSKLRVMILRHVTPPVAIAILALVFAMSGGAFALSGTLSITSNPNSSTHATLAAKKAKVKLLRGPRGPEGKQGPVGPPGPTGPKGEPGSAGTNGSNGTNGGNGVSVASEPASKAECEAGGTKFMSASGTSKVCNGKQGAPGTFEGLPLPEGKSLKGTYAANTYSEVAFPCASCGAAAAVTFVAPLSKEPVSHYIKENEALPPGCTGNAEEPGAESGNLCVFSQGETNVLAIFPPQPPLRGKAGETLGFEIVGVPAAKGNIYIHGTWAVTAG
jgi:hypothetical protein